MNYTVNYVTSCKLFGFHLARIESAEAFRQGLYSEVCKYYSLIVFVVLFTSLSLSFYILLSF